MTSAPLTLTSVTPVEDMALPESTTRSPLVTSRSTSPSLATTPFIFISSLGAKPSVPSGLTRTTLKLSPPALVTVTDLSLSTYTSTYTSVAESTASFDTLNFILSFAVPTLLALTARPPAVTFASSDAITRSPSVSSVTDPPSASIFSIVMPPFDLRRMFWSVVLTVVSSAMTIEPFVASTSIVPAVAVTSDLISTVLCASIVAF